MIHVMWVMWPDHHWPYSCGFSFLSFCTVTCMTQWLVLQFLEIRLRAEDTGVSLSSYCIPSRMRYFFRIKSLASFTRLKFEGWSSNLSIFLKIFLSFQARFWFRTYICLFHFRVISPACNWPCSTSFPPGVECLRKDSWFIWWLVRWTCNIVGADGWDYGMHNGTLEVLLLFLLCNHCCSVSVLFWSHDSVETPIA